MSKQLNIGSLKLPLESATKGFAFIGKRGSGKSYSAAVFAEELAKCNLPFVIFDPIDVWWGLRLKADGKGKGLPVVVFGREHADIQLDRTMGKRIAQAVVKENISCVISTFGLNKTEMREVVADFSEELLRINNTPRQVIIEEAHEFVPQRVMGAGARCFSAVEALLVMGRNRGIGVTLLNQRMATLNKDLLTQIDVLVAFRSVGPQDRKAFKDWVEVHNDENDDNFDEFMKTVPGLPTGEAWVWSPEFLELFKRIKFRKRETFHPDREKIGSTFKMPEIKQGDIQSFIDSFSKKPEHKIVMSPKSAITSNKSVITVNASPADKKAEYDKGYVYGKKESDLHWQKEVEKERASWRRLVSHLDKIHLQASNLFAGSKRPEVYLAGGQKITPPKFETLKMPAAPTVPSVLTKREVYNPPVNVTATGDAIVSRSEQKILDAVLYLNVIGNELPRKEAVALVAGMRPTSGGFKNYCGSLRSKGLIDYPEPNKIALTEVGKPLTQVPGIMSTTNEQFHAEVLGRLSNPEQAVLKPLLDNGGEQITKDELAALTPYQPTSGGFKNILGTLRSMGLIDYPVPNSVKAETLMFPFGI